VAYSRSASDGYAFRLLLSFAARSESRTIYCISVLRTVVRQTAKSVSQVGLDCICDFHLIGTGRDLVAVLSAVLLVGNPLTGRWLLLRIPLQVFRALWTRPPVVLPLHLSWRLETTREDALWAIAARSVPPPFALAFLFSCIAGAFLIRLGHWFLDSSALLFLAPNFFYGEMQMPSRHFTKWIRPVSPAYLCRILFLMLLYPEELTRKLLPQ